MGWPTMGQSDARVHPRFAVEVDGVAVFGAVRLPIRTRDLSRGGLCFGSRQPVPLGGELALRLSLVFDEKTYSEPMQLRARIVWCTRLGDGVFQVGTAFVGLTSESRAYLEMFLRYLKEGSGGDDGGEDGDEEVFG